MNRCETITSEEEDKKVTENKKNRKTNQKKGELQKLCHHLKRGSFHRGKKKAIWIRKTEAAINRDE